MSWRREYKGQFCSWFVIVVHIYVCFCVNYVLMFRVIEKLLQPLHTLEIEGIVLRLLLLLMTKS